MSDTRAWQEGKYHHARARVASFVSRTSTRRVTCRCQRIKKVVEMVSDLFARFDDLSDKYLIYKIETVRDLDPSG